MVHLSIGLSGGLFILFGLLILMGKNIAALGLILTQMLIVIGNLACEYNMLHLFLFVTAILCALFGAYMLYDRRGDVQLLGTGLIGSLFFFISCVIFLISGIIGLSELELNTGIIYLCFTIGTITLFIFLADQS